MNYSSLQNNTTKRATHLATMIVAFVAFALAFCLAGCSSESSSINLDKTVTNEGLTYKVPSEWESSTNGDNSYSEYSSEDGSIVGSVMCSSIPYKNADEYNGAFIDYIYSTDNADYANVTSSEVENTDIDGASCTVYEYSFDCKFENEENYSHTDGCYAYIDGAKMLYIIQFSSFSGDNCVALVEAILDTASIES